MDGSPSQSTPSPSLLEGKRRSTSSMCFVNPSENRGGEYDEEGVSEEEGVGCRRGASSRRRVVCVRYVLTRLGSVGLYPLDSVYIPYLPTHLYARRPRHRSIDVKGRQARGNRYINKYPLVTRGAFGMIVSISIDTTD